MNYLEYLDINALRRELKEKYKLLPDCEEKIEEIFNRGVLFKNTEISVVIKEYYNHLAGRDCKWYYFTCPKCTKNCRKLYVTGNLDVACRVCSKIKDKLKVSSQVDRVLKIQMNLTELFRKNITAKRRRSLIKDITIHYQQLDDQYKMAYNTIAFKELQKWCLENSNDKDKSAGYRKASKDMLKILRDIRKMLVFSGLSISRNEKLKI